MRPDVEPGLDAKEAAALARRLGRPLAEADFARLVALEPRGAFSARAPGGALVGCITSVLWSAPEGALAWLGEPLAADDDTRRALLQHAMERARGQGATSLGLDADAATRALAESLGFHATGETALWARPAEAPRPPPGPSGKWAIYPVSSCEIMELHGYDAPVFGASRGRHLADLISRFPYRSFVAVDRKSGAFSGFVLSEDDRIGPLAADSPEAAAWLLHAAERAGTPPRALVGPSPEARAFFAAAGYVPAGETRTRMVAGAPLPGLPARVLAIAGWPLG